ncbi:MAG TPA: cache domain-containing protein, partial [Ramlibacter sp.]|nr:cache domain-containing protein [Ramlibacter sp.]
MQEEEGATARHAEARSPARPLRYRLFQLAASGLLPLALVATFVIAWLVQDRRDEAQRSALEVSRALATAVDAELRATISALQTLGLSDELQPAQMQAFQALARRVAERHGWRSVLLADNTGRVLMSSALQLGSAPPQLVDAESMARAVTTRQAAVGHVAEGPNKRGAAFAVRVPIMLGSEVEYVLSAVIPADHILAVLTRQGIASSWLVSVYDQTGMRVARSKEHASARPSPSLQAMLDNGRMQDSGTTTTLEGVAAYTGYTRLKDSGWVVVAGLLASEANSAVYPMLAAVAAGLLASLALSAFLAWLLARRVSQPIDALRSAAVALGTGDRVELQPLGVAELDQVATALTQAGAERDRAARERREAEAEREALLARVTEALRMAEDAGRSKDEFLAMLGHELRNPLA